MAENEGPAGDKSIPFNEYCQYIGQALKLDNYESYFKHYLKDNETFENLFEAEHQWLCIISLV